MIASCSGGGRGLAQDLHFLDGGQMGLALAVDLGQPTQKVLVVLPLDPFFVLDGSQVLKAKTFLNFGNFFKDIMMFKTICEYFVFIWNVNYFYF